MIRVFLLDDRAVVRRGMVELLQAAGDIEVVGESGLAQEATRRIPALRPHVAVLDARLPDGNGIDVCREVRLGQARSGTAYPGRGARHQAARGASALSRQQTVSPRSRNC